ncbi:QacE family quaternary ammonium compound efflux SMR transporter [Pectobacterium carotovorum subsp. carotovorum]|nr:QacE family quaternary ammonium compound efflux SMR transporter [Pectobacterium carotovorum subsp. carotovorum]GKX41152.1 QacE family quaternary ammonium compound efflux SMR transporter [Pectobacterium carotovorum subsp. carotovorum]GLX56665.1 QacE family quaternary ammonium compound efflux SMR transporter [Pectobacterium carotovorum subsp. carotovorum]
MSLRKRSWLWMLLVILSETSATSTLKMFDDSQGATKIALLAVIILLYCVCYYSLSKAVKHLPVGLAYATWSGTGILLVSTLSIVFYGQRPDIPAIIGMVVIATGIAIMNLFSKMGVDEQPETLTSSPQNPPLNTKIIHEK